MDKDPSSYRVPVLRLTNVFKKKTDDDDTDKKNTAPEGSVPKDAPENVQTQAQQPASTVSEEDIAAAVITPSTPSDNQANLSTQANQQTQTNQPTQQSTPPPPQQKPQTTPPVETGQQTAQAQQQAVPQTPSPGAQQAPAQQTVPTQQTESAPQTNQPTPTVPSEPVLQPNVPQAPPVQQTVQSSPTNPSTQVDQPVQTDTSQQNQQPAATPPNTPPTPTPTQTLDTSKAPTETHIPINQASATPTPTPTPTPEVQPEPIPEIEDIPHEMPDLQAQIDAELQSALKAEPAPQIQQPNPEPALQTPAPQTSSQPAPPQVSQQQEPTTPQVDTSQGPVGGNTPAAQTNELDDDVDISDLINQTMQALPTEEPEPSPTTDDEPAEPEEEPKKKRDLFSLPQADPLDIWEQDEAKREKLRFERPRSTSISNISAETPSNNAQETPAPDPQKPTESAQEEEVKTSSAKEEETARMPQKDAAVTINTPVEEPTLDEFGTDATQPEETPTPTQKETQNDTRTESAVRKEGEASAAASGEKTGLSNLSALRARVLKEKQAQGPEATKAQDQSDTQQDGAAPTQRPRPTSKHASAIAGVAERLQALSKNATATVPPTGEKKSKPVQNRAVQEETLTPVERAIAADKAREKLEKKQKKTNTSQELEVKATGGVPRVRTFRHDVEKAVMKNKTSIVDMVSAEEKKRSLGETVRTAPKANESNAFTYVLIGASIVLLTVGLFIGGYFAYRHLFGDRIGDTPEIVPVNDTVRQDVTDSSGETLLIELARIKKALKANLNDFTEFQLIERFNEEDSTKVSVLDPYRFFVKIDADAPGPLVRTTGENMSIGIHTMQENEPYWVFNINHYETAFRGMLDWEDNMRRDLAPFFGEVDPPELIPNPVQSGSTSTTEYIRKDDPDVYEDVIILNKEARMLTDENGEILLIWTIYDEKNVIITTNRATFEILLERMDRPSQ